MTTRRDFLTGLLLATTAFHGTVSLLPWARGSFTVVVYGINGDGEQTREEIVLDRLPPNGVVSKHAYRNVQVTMTAAPRNITITNVADFASPKRFKQWH